MPMTQSLEEEIQLADLDVRQERQIQLESGVEWAPESWVRSGDIKEM